MSEDEDVQKITRSMRNAIGVITLSSSLSVRKNWLGHLRLNDHQAAWTYGFCDGFAMSIGLQNVEDSSLFTAGIFFKVFGKAGLHSYRNVRLSDAKTMLWVVDGGLAHDRWITNGASPLMPMRP